jgi:hypothetical protein
MTPRWDVGLKLKRPLRAWVQRLRALLNLSGAFLILGLQRLRALLDFSQGFPIPGPLDWLHRFWYDVLTEEKHGHQDLDRRRRTAHH